MEQMILLCFKSIAVCCGLFVMTLAWRVLNWVWLKPKKVEKYLRQQGLNGRPYRLLFGDINEMLKMIKEAKSKPISLSDDIFPRVSPFLHKTINIYGKKCFTWMGPIPMVHIMEPQLVREILTKIDEFQKPRGGNPLLKMLATGLFDAEGHRWAKHRKIINPAFHVDKLKHMLPAFYLSISEMIGMWEGMVGDAGYCDLDLWPYLETMPGDAISRTAFGSNYEEGRGIFEVQKEQAELIIEAGLSLYLPGFELLPTKRNKRIKEIYNQVQDLIRGIIEKRLKAMKAGEASNDDLLGILLESNYREIQRDENKDSGMLIDEVIEECRLFYLAGRETTSVLLLWTMVLLSQHSSWQERARDEVLQVFRKNKPDIDGLNRLKIVTMILHEVMRLYPPVISISRMIHEETKVGDMTLPAGTLVTLYTILVHHDPEFWGEDAKEFKPERFSEGVLKATKGQVSYFPFSWGPRICIGMNFAMLEVKLAVAMILQRFSFKLSPSYLHAPHSIVTLQPQYGAHFTLYKL